jgi:hypothetical protein
MHRSSESIGTIAGALAKAQAELANPEKSLTATIQLDFGGPRTVEPSRARFCVAIVDRNRSKCRRRVSARCRRRCPKIGCCRMTWSRRILMTC